MIKPTTNAVIAGNNLISFSGVPEASRGDVLDLLMYADFCATQIWRPDRQWTSWIEYYRKQLIYSGCQLTSQLVKEPMFIKQASELDNVRFGVVGAAKVNVLMAMAQRSFKAARLNDYARHFFQFGLDSGHFSAFQVVPCEGEGSGDISILICALHASATVSSDSRGGDWRINREMVVRLAGGVYSFSERGFAPHRPASPAYSVPSA